MQNVAVIGAGVTGITTAYALINRGHEVTVFDRNRYAAMEASFANGGQISASNAEVWNSWATVLKGIKWMLDRSAPLLVNPKPSWHKYSWMGEFVGAISHYRQNTIDTVRLAIQARDFLLSHADKEGFAFDCEARGILHVYTDAAEFEKARAVSKLLAEGGLERREVTPEEIRTIEPALTAPLHAGLHTDSDFTGDIHSYVRGLSKACERLGAKFHYDTRVLDIAARKGGGINVDFAPEDCLHERGEFDAVVVCAGVHSRAIAEKLGDYVNIYPVKGYSVTIQLDDDESRAAAPWVSLLDDKAKIVSSRFGDDRLRIAGTAEFNGFNRDIRDDRIRPLTKWCQQFFPAVSTEHAVPWAGLRPMMPNMLPRVGAGNRPGVYYNTGHGHLGWTLSAATAEIVAEDVTVGAGQASPYRATNPHGVLAMKGIRP